MVLKFSNNDLEKFHKAVLEDDKYGSENILIKQILEKYPTNTSREIVAMKISLIDVTNSTNLSRYKSKISLSDLTTVICKIEDFDKRVENGDPTLVKEIANQKRINLFSFATKYCCYHNYIIYKRDDYSIYDGILKSNLKKYIDVKENQIEKWRKNCDYESYHNLIGEILSNNNIDIKDKRRKFDHFVWWQNR